MKLCVSTVKPMSSCAFSRTEDRAIFETEIVGSAADKMKT